MHNSKEIIKSGFELETQKYDNVIRHFNDQDARIALTELFRLLSENNNLEDKNVKKDINVFVIRIIFSFFFDSLERTEDFCITKILKGLLITETMRVEKSIKYLFDGFKNKDKFVNSNFAKNNLFEYEALIPNISLDAHRHLITFEEIDWRHIDLNVIYECFIEFNKGDYDYSFKPINYKEISHLLDGLFLNDLDKEFNHIKYNPNFLVKLRKKISNINILDPNCSSGACLVVAYEKLCELEIKIISQLQLLGKNPSSELVKTAQLHGIEKNVTEFLLARLSITITDYRMQLKRKAQRNVRRYQFSYNSSSIINQDGLTYNWDNLCSTKGMGTYVIGNLYEDRASELHNGDLQKEWTLKTVEYIRGTGVKAAFLYKTNIGLNRLTDLLWKTVFENKLHIKFLFKPFKKEDSEEVTIIGLSPTNEAKWVYALEGNNVNSYNVPVITPVLNDNPFKLTKDLLTNYVSQPICVEGISSNSGSFLPLSEKEKEGLIKKYPQAAEWIKKLMGSEEFNETLNNWCLWYGAIPFKDLPDLKKIRSLIYSIKIQKRKGADDFKPMVNIFSLSTDSIDKQGYTIVIPKMSPRSRSYYPMGFYPSSNLISKTFVIKNASIYLFGILSSSMFNEWIALNNVGNESNHYFSIETHYNTFPWPNPNRGQIALVERLAEEILMIRESFPQYNIKSLYGVTTMPTELLEAHIKLDTAVEEIFNPNGFKNSLDRKQYLAFLYSRELGCLNEKI